MEELETIEDDFRVVPSRVHFCVDRALAGVCAHRCIWFPGRRKRRRRGVRVRKCAESALVV